MSDLRHPCEPWAESISLAAAGCLAPDQLGEVRRHVETCDECRQRYQQLAQLCGALTEAQLPAGDVATAIVPRVMSAIAADESRRRQATRAAETLHPTLLNRSQQTWRWIMRSPVSRLSAAAIFVLAITGFAVWFHGDGAQFAFADFAEPILKAKSAEFNIATEAIGPPAATTTGKVLVLDARRSRQEMEITMPGAAGSPQAAKSKMVMIFDWNQGKSLTLDPTTKTAVVMSLTNLTQEQAAQQDMFAWFRSILADARDQADVKREPLGEKTIDGRRIVGFRVTSRGMTVDLWGDPETGLPVRAEGTMVIFPNIKTVMSDFQFDVELDESLFSVEPPAGYTVQNMSIDVSPPTEQDLIAMFRLYSELSGGPLPESLDLPTMLQAAGKFLGMKAGLEAAREKLRAGNKQLSEEQLRRFEELMHKILAWQLDPEKEKPSDEEIRQTEELRKLAGGEQPPAGEGAPDEDQRREAVQAEARKVADASVKKLVALQSPLQRGVMFAAQLPPEADAHYAGQGVSVAAADTPIFWYRPQGSKTYRVVYADLSVRDAEAPPEATSDRGVTEDDGLRD